MEQQEKTMKSFQKDYAKKEVQLKEAVELINNKNEVIFTFKHKDIIGFDEVTKTLIYSEEQTESVTTTEAQRNDAILEKQGYNFKNIGQETLDLLNPEVIGLLKVSNARRTKSSFNPFR